MSVGVPLVIVNVMGMVTVTVMLRFLVFERRWRVAVSEAMSVRVDVGMRDRVVVRFDDRVEDMTSLALTDMDNWRLVERVKLSVAVIVSDVSDDGVGAVRLSELDKNRV